MLLPFRYLRNPPIRLIFQHHSNLKFNKKLFILGIACFCQDHETLPVLILKSIAVFFSLLNFYGFFAYWVSLFKSPECLTKGLKIDLGITETVYFLLILFISIGLAIDHFEYESSCLSL